MREELEKIKSLSREELEDYPYDKLVGIIDNLTIDEIIKFSNMIGYPLFTRLCMGKLRHKFVLLQDGAAAIITNRQGQILLQNRADNNGWGLPGGCQELGERLEDTIIREVKEETNLDVLEENLELISIVSGSSRRRNYPNGDVVINNTALYLIKKYSGNIKWNNESREMKFFDLDSLPTNQHDSDLVANYINYLNKNR